MWMLVTFDLPVETRKQRAAAAKFRMALLDLGFEMSQFSNYLRFCNGKEQFDLLAPAFRAALQKVYGSGFELMQEGGPRELFTARVKAPGAGRAADLRARLVT